MILLRRKSKIDPRRRDLALETAQRREGQAVLKERVERLIKAKPRDGLEPSKS